MKKDKIDWIFWIAVVISIILSQCAIRLMGDNLAGFLTAVGTVLIILIPVGLWRLSRIKVH